MLNSPRRHPFLENVRQLLLKSHSIILSHHKALICMPNGSPAATAIVAAALVTLSASPLSKPLSTEPPRRV